MVFIENGSRESRSESPPWRERAQICPLLPTASLPAAPNRHIWITIIQLLNISSGFSTSQSPGQPKSYRCDCKEIFFRHFSEQNQMYCGSTGMLSCQCRGSLKERKCWMPRVPGQGMSTGPEPSWPFSSPSMETKSRMPDDQYFQSSYSCRVNIVKSQIEHLLFVL